MKEVKGFHLEFSCNGFHRIVAPDGTAGDFESYSSLSILRWKGKTYVAGTQYGLLPSPETVYAIEPQPTETMHAPEAACASSMRSGKCIDKEVQAMKAEDEGGIQRRAGETRAAWIGRMAKGSAETDTIAANLLDGKEYKALSTDERSVASGLVERGVCYWMDEFGRELDEPGQSGGIVWLRMRVIDDERAGRSGASR